MQPNALKGLADTTWSVTELCALYFSRTMMEALAGAPFEAELSMAFAKLDKNRNGALSFDEWAVKTIGKFQGADKDRTGWLTPAEYASTAPPPSKKKRCSC